MINVRAYQQEDEQCLRDLAMQNYAILLPDDQPADLYSDAAEAYFAHILQIQAGGRGFIYVAEDDDALLGFVCLLAPVEAEGDAGNKGIYAFLSDLYVAEGQCNKGVGALLNARAEQQALALGIERIALRVAAGNSAARKFYLREQYAEKFVVMSKPLSR